MPFSDAIRIGASGATSYEVERSIRGDDDQSSPRRLTRTVQSGGNRKKFTISFWVKRSQLGNTAYSNSSGNDGQSILHTVGQSNRGWLKFDSDDTIGFDQGYDSGGSGGRLTTLAKFRDVGAWYHILVVADYANGTAADRAKIFVNGVRQEVTIDNAFTDTDGKLNSNQQHEIGYAEYGQGYTGSSWWFNFFCGYFAEFYFIDGQALDPTSFTETNAVTGQIVPKEYDGTFGTTGWYLAFTDNSGVTATTLGKDYSGNSNNWTPGGFSVSAGVDNDSVTDTPTNNFCTYNFLNKTNSTNLHKGNLYFSQSANDQVAVGTMAITSGKWYYEFLKVSGDNPEVGIVAIDSLNPATNGQKVSFSGSSSGDITGFKIALITNNGQQRNGIDYGDPGAISLTGGSAQTGAGYIGIAIDMDNSKIWYTDLSGNFFNSGNPATGANAAYDFSSTRAANGAVPFVYFATASGDVGSVNFGQQPFNHTQPTGFKSICSANLPAPSIKLPNKHFDTLIYTGNGSSSHAITGLDFAPDWVWGRRRDGNGSHFIFDSVRGATKRLGNSGDGIGTGAESTVADSLKSFDSNGFTYGNENGNNNGENYVAWNWKGGGSASSNSAGTITSSVSANTSAGFSIVTYSGNSTANATVGHGLNVKPDCIIIKTRNASDNWMVYHQRMDSSSAEDYFIELNENAARVDSTNMLNDTAPTSSLVTLSADGSVNSSSRTYVMYCFSGVEGYSKFGNFGGNGSTNGTFVYTGFRPAWLLIKRIDSTSEWSLFDTTRRTYNVMDLRLEPDSNSAQDSHSVNYHDILSNGFKMRNSDAARNGSGNSYIYIAFAESPFKNSRAR